MKIYLKNWQDAVTRVGIVAGMILALTASKPVFSADIYDAKGFENPPFIAGDLLVGDDGWVGVSILNPQAAIISTDSPFAGSQSVRVAGGDMVRQDSIKKVTKGYYDAIGSYRRNVDYDVAANGFPIVRIQAKVRVDGPSTPSGNNFFSASIAARANHAPGNGPKNGEATVGIGELAISSDGQVYGYSGNDNVPTFLTSASITLGEWHTLAIDLDFSAKTYSFIVDNAPLGTFGFNSDVNTDILRRGSLVTYAAPDTATLHKSNYAVHYDNFSITTQ